MNLSAPFIKRPIATTLLTAALVLSGLSAFRVLPVSPLPQVDFPTMSVSASLARRQPGDHGLVGRHAARAGIRPDRLRDRNDLAKHSGPDEHHAAVRSESQHRCGDARRRIGDQCRAQLSAGESAEQSDLSEGESGRCADHDHRADVGQAAAVRTLRRRLDDPRAEALADHRRGPGGRRRQFGAGGAHQCESDAALRVWNRARQRAHGGRGANRQRGQGQLCGRRRTLVDRRQRSADESGGLCAADRFVQQRRSRCSCRRSRTSRIRCKPCGRWGSPTATVPPC